MIRRLRRRAADRNLPLNMMKGTQTWSMFFVNYEEEVWWWEGTIAGGRF